MSDFAYARRRAVEIRDTTKVEYTRDAMDGLIRAIDAGRVEVVHFDAGGNPCKWETASLDRIPGGRPGGRL